jgi:hypothetical protein
MYISTGHYIEFYIVTSKFASCIKQQFQVNSVQPNQNIPTSSQPATDNFRNIETNVSLQNAIDIDIFQGYNKTEAVPMAMENALFDVKS